MYLYIDLAWSSRKHLYVVNCILAQLLSVQRQRLLLNADMRFLSFWQLVGDLMSSYRGSTVKLDGIRAYLR